MQSGAFSLWKKHLPLNNQLLFFSFKTHIPNRTGGGSPCDPVTSIPPPNPPGILCFPGGAAHWKSNSPSKRQADTEKANRAINGSFILPYLVASRPSGGSQVPPGHKNKPAAPVGPSKCKHKGPLVCRRSSVRLEGQELV